MNFNRSEQFRYRTLPEPHLRPPSLSDTQLGLVMNAASTLPPAKRNELLQRIAARLRLIAGHPSDADVEHALTLALRGLVCCAQGPPPHEPMLL